MKQQKWQKLGLIFSLLVVVCAWVAFETFKDSFEGYFSAASDEEGATRLVSLGTPTEVSKPFGQEAHVILNDPNMNRNWALGDSSDKGIKVSQAWSISQGSKDVKIAIIDTGIDVDHPDIKNNLWTNPGEVGDWKPANNAEAKAAPGCKYKSCNNIDDDKNGFKDDVHGWNFVSNNNDLTDNHGHGTHVAGIAGAEGGNGIGVSGVAPHVSLMILKYYDPKAAGNDNLRNTIKAMYYAVMMKANVINYSGGGLDYSKEEFEAVKLAQKNGILFVAAAGNEKSNSDQQPYYPANYALDNIISVTAINPMGKVLSSSNFGEKSVHLAAPGEGIYSTLPGNKYGIMTGTSQATAFVSGVAALIQANNSEFNYLQVKKQILNTANQSEDMMGKSKTAGILNSYAALAIQPSIAASGAVVAQGTGSNPSLPENGTTTAGPISISRQLGGIMDALRIPAKQN